jgi:hypothetical protein
LSTRGSEAKFDAERSALIVDHGEEELLLPAERFQIIEAAVIGVVFERSCPSLGKAIGEPRRRGEGERTQTLE